MFIYIYTYFIYFLFIYRMFVKWDRSRGWEHGRNQGEQ